MNRTSESPWKFWCLQHPFGAGAKPQHPLGAIRLRRGSVLGDGLCALRDGVLGELTGEDEAHSSLDLTRGEGALQATQHRVSRVTQEWRRHFFARNEKPRNAT